MNNKKKLPTRAFFTKGVLTKILTNPFYAITVDPIFTQEHEHLVTREQWVASCVRLVKTEEITIEELLQSILNNLEGDYLETEVD